MFDIFSNSIDFYKNSLLIVTLILCFIRVGGVSFFIKLLLKALRLDYSNSKIKLYEEDFFNAQLFRLFNGVNVKSAKDAELVCEALSEGEIKRSDFRFSGFFGPVGVNRQDRMSVILMSGLFVFCLVCALSLMYLSPPMKLDYTTYNYHGDVVLISHDNVYDPTEKKYFNKKTCSANDEKKEIIKLSCEYLITSDSEMKKELSKAIDNERASSTIYLTLVLFFASFGGIMFVGYMNFLKINKIICNLKNR
ncbi:hypothetical protein [Pectobacterium brasiliense]|uniref:hypothetical protein n=1 Tax=Pectobacterium brasiliense TaxID=180957 RepID=UPI001969672E|nr:hypothetical protein [Pectobacterium brasiliense]MBN3265153.1 hypothetical protein [Pectobacterium brasiliense]